MALTNGGCKHVEILVNFSLKATKKKKKKDGYGHLKNSSERSRAILAVLNNYCPLSFILNFCQGHNVQALKAVNLNLHTLIEHILEKYSTQEP